MSSSGVQSLIPRAIASVMAMISPSTPLVATESATVDLDLVIGGNDTETGRSHHSARPIAPDAPDAIEIAPSCDHRSFINLCDLSELGHIDRGTGLQKQLEGSGAQKPLQALRSPQDEDRWALRADRLLHIHSGPIRVQLARRSAIGSTVDVAFPKS